MKPAALPYVGLSAFIALLSALYIALTMAAGTVPSRPITLLIAFDTSKSDRSQLPGFVAMALPLVGSLNPTTDRLSMWRMDANVRRFHDGPPIASREKLARMLVKELSPKATSPSTAFHQMWRALADALEHSTEPTVVVLYSDGIPDGSTVADRAASHDAIGRIARCPNLAGFAVIGVHDVAWSGLAVDLGPVSERLGADRFHMLGEHYTDLTPVFGVVERVRREGARRAQ